MAPRLILELDWACATVHPASARTSLVMSHVTELRVRFYELDPYDHVNHTNYLAYFETARIEYLSEVGFGLDVLKRLGYQLVVTELTARFLAAASLHDRLAISTAVGDIGRVRSTWHQEMRRGDEAVATLEVKAAFTDLDGRPRRVPDDFAAAVLPSVEAGRDHG